MNGVSFSPNNQYVVSGSDDKTVRIWDVESGDCIKTLKGHTSNVRGVSFAPNNQSNDNAAAALFFGMNKITIGMFLANAIVKTDSVLAYCVWFTLGAFVLLMLEFAIIARAAVHRPKEVVVLPLDWCNDTDVLEETEFDVILGADLMYDPKLAIPLAKTITQRSWHIDSCVFYLPCINLFYTSVFEDPPSILDLDRMLNTLSLLSALMLTIAMSFPMSFSFGEFEAARESVVKDVKIYLYGLKKDLFRCFRNRGDT